MTQDWISVKEKLPVVHDDIETALESQQTSDMVLIKLQQGLRWNNKSEAEAHYVVRFQMGMTRKGMWSFDKCALGDYFDLEIATHWMPIPDLPKPTQS